MKRIFLLLLLLFAVESYGQTITQSPEIDDQSSYETDITRVELTNEYTIIHFRYQFSQRRGQGYNLPFQKQPQQTISTISINPRSYLNGNGKRFRYIRATGIKELPDSQQVYPGEEYRFKVYYERLDPGIELFNLIEGKNSPEQSMQYWNFYGVRIKNPQRKLPNSPAVSAVLTIKGRLIDARSQQPISGRVEYQMDNDAKNSGYRLTQPQSGFTFSLKPGAYTLVATAIGYEKAETSIDLSNISRTQQFTQDIYLNPVTRKPVARPEAQAIEKPKEEEVIAKTPVPTAETTSPVKVEENKFRLDKVYFNTGESGLLPESFSQLDGLLQMLKDKPDMTIVIEGHTDNIGDPTQNRRLSLERAFNVREYLISKGVAGKRIQFKGYGDTKPIATNDTEEGRKQNRRVEFVIED